MAYGNWKKNYGGETPMQARYGSIGNAISGTQIVGNYYDAVAQYREAQRQAFENYSKMLKADADKMQNTNMSFVADKNDPRGYGITGKANTIAGPTQEDVDRVNSKANLEKQKQEKAAEKLGRTSVQIDPRTGMEVATEVLPTREAGPKLATEAWIDAQNEIGNAYQAIPKTDPEIQRLVGLYNRPKPAVSPLIQTAIQKAGGGSYRAGMPAIPSMKQMLGMQIDGQTQPPDFDAMGAIEPTQRIADYDLRSAQDKGNPAVNIMQYADIPAQPQGPPQPPTQSTQTPAQGGSAFNAWRTGLNDETFQDPRIQNAFTARYNSYGDTQKGMADFMQRLMEIEANEGTRMDKTASFAMEDPKDVRGTSPAGMPTMADIAKMPENMRKRWLEDQDLAIKFAKQVENQDVDRYISEVSRQYPEAASLLKTDGFVTMMPDGSFQFNAGKLEEGKLTPDVRRNITEFIDRLGVRGWERWNELKFGTKYQRVDHPEIGLMNKPKEQYDHRKEVIGDEGYLMFPDASGGSTVGAALIIPNKNQPYIAKVSPQDPLRTITLWKWKNGDDEIYQSDNGDYRYKYRDSQGKMQDRAIPGDDVYRKIKEKGLKPEEDIRNGKQATIDLSKFGATHKSRLQGIVNFSYAAKNNNPDQMGRYSTGGEATGSAYKPSREGGVKTETKYTVTNPDGSISQVTETTNLTPEQRKQVEEQKKAAVQKKMENSWLYKNNKNK